MSLYLHFPFDDQDHKFYDSAMMTGLGHSNGATKPLSQHRAARILGVSFEHLNRVLRGHRQSKRLLVLYQELMTLPANKTKSKT